MVQCHSSNRVLDVFGQREGLHHSRMTKDRRQAQCRTYRYMLYEYKTILFMWVFYYRDQKGYILDVPSCSTSISAPLGRLSSFPPAPLAPAYNLAASLSLTNLPVRAIFSWKIPLFWGIVSDAPKSWNLGDEHMRRDSEDSPYDAELANGLFALP